MTVWFGGVAPDGRALSDEFIERVSSDGIQFDLSVEGGVLWIRTAEEIPFRVRRACDVMSVGVYAYKHSMEPIYGPKEFTSGMKKVVEGNLINVFIGYELIHPNVPRRENIKTFMDMLGRMK
jgi:hypothetical protein